MKTLSRLIAACALLAVVGCSEEAATPEAPKIPSPTEVTVAFNQALIAGDLATASQYITDLDRPILTQMVSALAMMTEEERAQAKSMLERLEFSETIDGDTAIVNGSLDGKPSDAPLKLIKEGGAWKIKLTN